MKLMHLFPTLNHWSNLLTLSCVLSVFLTGALFITATVHAHANVVKSRPASDSIIDYTPDKIIIWFTEPLEPKFSEIRVLDLKGLQIDNRDSSVDSHDSRIMYVGVPSLTKGSYTVAWKNVSTIDGHSVRGSFIFSVGAPSSDLLQHDLPQESLFQYRAEPIVRWLLLLSALTMVGALFFEQMVISPILTRRSSDASMVHLKRLVLTRIFILLCIAMSVFVLASLTQLIYQTSQTYDTSIYRALGSNIVSVLIDTNWGKMWLWRMVIFLPMVSLTILALRYKSAIRREIIKSLSFILGLGILLTFSLTSHAAATPEISTVAVINDYFHLLSSSIWVAGIFSFALTIPIVINTLTGSMRRYVMSSLMARFSLLACISVAILAVTGLYSAWAQVTVLPALEVPYGRALISKLVIAGPLLALGALNFLWISRQLRRNERASQWLRWIINVESVLAILLLLAVGFIVSLEPARQVASRAGIGYDRQISFTENVERVNINLDISPGEIGLNTFTISLYNSSGAPLDGISEIIMKNSYLGEDLGEDLIYLNRFTTGIYIADDINIALAGRWQTALSIKRSDGFDIKTAYRYPVNVMRGGSSTISPSNKTSKIFLGVEIILLGVIFMGIGIPVGGWYSRRGISTIASGIVLFIAGTIVLVNYGSIDSGVEGNIRNPIPPNMGSLETGKVLYEKYCQTCHGPGGLGDGSSAVYLDSAPANLQTHVPLHPDRDLFNFIYNGITDTEMKGMKNTLSNEEVWHIVNYIQTFE